MSIRYQVAYNELGNERRQNDVPIDLVEVIGSKSRHTPFEQFWTLRRDLAWAEAPYKKHFNRKLRKVVFSSQVTEIIKKLGDNSSGFHPKKLWEKEKEKEEKLIEEANAQASSESSKKEKGKKEKEVVKKGADKMKEDNDEKRRVDGILAEITRIRNCKKNLTPLVRDMKTQEGRIVLLVELLNIAFSSAIEKRVNEAFHEAYEILWAIEALGLIEFDAPWPDKKKVDYKTVFPQKREDDIKLVYDKYRDAQKLVAKVQTHRSERDDLIKLQLTVMSNSLPPLSKYNFDFKLDEWQKKALRWIEEEKSVIITAPTSSGKTVISTLVALPGKRKEATTIEKKPVEEDDDDDEGDMIVDEDGDDAVGGDDSEAISGGGDGDSARATPRVSQKKGAVLDKKIFVPEDSAIDQKARQEFNQKFAVKEEPRILFVVPTEPLVWQVAAYFSKILDANADNNKTKIAIVTDQLQYNPKRVYGFMPQIVVGTPLALESALTKCRGAVGRYEHYGKAQGDILPGGFDHFDWVIYDEVHALDGDEGDALERLVRMMTCKFLALSATIGNSEQLREWMERVKGEQMKGVQTMDVRVDATTNELAEVSLNEIKVGSFVKEGSLVNLISHEVRFINLQRYVWQDSKLKELSPLAAVESVESLQSGLLLNSGLSFTSSDSYRLWKEIELRYPAAAIQDYSPHVFFQDDARIDLKRTKDYENHLKQGLTVLSRDYPNETHELLFTFRVEDTADKSFDLCDLVQTLVEKDMIPCLPFHLNTFDAIRLFQQLLGGIEYRQKVAYPKYYFDEQKRLDELKKDQAQRKKDTGKNSKDALELEKEGDMMNVDYSLDPYEPHPKFRFTKAKVFDNPIDLEDLCDAMERFDGFEKREEEAMKTQRGKSDKVLSHALMRGLRRGIGLYIKEVSFPSYRRFVQKLASAGKLGVVISDDSLAFGVNMPFRTCIFCGEMNGLLNPLMAQQMAGRAGRRGLDTQGNIVYVGSRPSFIRELMIGKVAKIQGAPKSPKYPTMFLQGMLSTRHVGWSRVKLLGGVTINEFMQKLSNPVNDAYEESKNALIQLGLIEEKSVPLGDNRTVKAYVPNRPNDVEWQGLMIVWELRKYLPESITLGRLLSKLYDELEPISRTINRDITKKGKDTSKLNVALTKFFPVILQLIDRVPCIDGETPMHESSYLSEDHLERKNLFDKWGKLYEEDQRTLPESLSYVKSTVKPGEPLDGKLLKIILQENLDGILEKDKQALKERLWKVGDILLTIHNIVWTYTPYYEVFEVIFRGAFQKCFYLNSELIRGFINFDDVAAQDRESRTDTADNAKMASNISSKWADNDNYEPPSIFTNPWNTAIKTGIERMRTWCANNSADLSKVNEERRRARMAFPCLTIEDELMISLGENAAPSVDGIARAISTSSLGKKSQRDRIDILCWLLATLFSSSSKKFPIYMQKMHENDYIDEATIFAWHKGTDCPNGATSIADNEYNNFRVLANPFIQWLEQAEEEDDDDDDDDDDE